MHMHACLSFPYTFCLKFALCTLPSLRFRRDNMSWTGPEDDWPQQELQLYLLGPPVRSSDDLETFMEIFLKAFLVADAIVVETEAAPPVQYHVLFDPDEDCTRIQSGHGKFGLDIYAVTVRWRGEAPSRTNFSVVGKDAAYFGADGVPESERPWSPEKAVVTTRREGGRKAMGISL